MNQEVKRWTRLLGGLLTTLLFSWMFLRHLDWGMSAAVLADASLFHLLMAIGLLAIGYALRILRWWIMLRSISPDLTFVCCAGPLLSGMALNNILPFRAGDVIRAVGFRQQLKLLPTRVLITIVIERLFDLTALLIVFLVGLWGIGSHSMPEGVLTAVYLLTACCVVVLLLCVFLSVQMERWVRRLANAASRRGANVVGYAGMAAAQIFSDLALMRSPLLVMKVFGLSLGVWLFEGAMFAAVAHAIGLSDAGLGTWLAMATGTLATLIPSTPGYVGTFDYFTMLGLTMHDMPEQLAAVFAIAVHVMLWVPVTFVGLLWLCILKLGTSRAERPMEILT
jgi:glycosyltransferase 2 family protein